MMAQRRLETMATSRAPAWRCSQGILAGLVEIEIMMGMLDGRDFQAALQSAPGSRA